MSDVPDTLLVHRCTEPKPLTSSGTIACGRCKLDCWIAPTSIAVLYTYPMIRVLCLPCAGELAAQHGPTIRELRFAEGAAEEIAKASKPKNKRR